MKILLRLKGKPIQKTEDRLNFSRSSISCGNSMTQNHMYSYKNPNAGGEKDSITLPLVENSPALKRRRNCQDTDIQRDSGISKQKKVEQKSKSLEEEKRLLVCSKKITIKLPPKKVHEPKKSLNNKRKYEDSIFDSNLEEEEEEDEVVFFSSKTKSRNKARKMDHAMVTAFLNDYVFVVVVLYDRCFNSLINATYVITGYSTQF